MIKINSIIIEAKKPFYKRKQTKLPLNKSNLVDSNNKFETYLVKPRKYNHLFAIKKFKVTDDHNQHDKLYNKFMTKQYLISDLEHENVLKYYQPFILNGIHYQFTEYAPSSLLLSSKTKRISNKLCLKYIGQIISAVCFLHLNSFSHGNIKLENISIDKYNNVKLAALDTKELDTKSTDLIQNINQYSPPEALSTSNLIDEYKADIWSIGIIWIYLRFNHFLWDKPTVKNHVYRCLVHKSSEIVKQFSQYKIPMLIFSILCCEEYRLDSNTLNACMQAELVKNK